MEAPDPARARRRARPTLGGVEDRKPEGRGGGVGLWRSLGTSTPPPTPNSGPRARRPPFSPAARGAGTGPRRLARFLGSSCARGPPTSSWWAAWAATYLARPHHRGPLPRGLRAGVPRKGPQRPVLRGRVGVRDLTSAASQVGEARGRARPLRRLVRGPPRPLPRRRRAPTPGRSGAKDRFFRKTVLLNERSLPP